MITKQGDKPNNIGIKIRVSDAINTRSRDELSTGYQQ